MQYKVYENQGLFHCDKKMNVSNRGNIHDCACRNLVGTCCKLIDKLSGKHLNIKANVPMTMKKD